MATLKIQQTTSTGVGMLVPLHHRARDPSVITHWEPDLVRNGGCYKSKHLSFREILKYGSFEKKLSMFYTKVLSGLNLSVLLPAFSSAYILR